MTVAASGAGRLRLRVPENRLLNWEMIGVLLAVLANLAAGVWFASALNSRVGALESQLPPGFVQRLDERTEFMARALGYAEPRIPRP